VCLDRVKSLSWLRFMWVSSVSPGEFMDRKLKWATPDSLLIFTRSPCIHFFGGEWITALSAVSRILFPKPLYFAIGHLLDPFYACPFRLASSNLLGVYLFFRLQGGCHWSIFFGQRWSPILLTYLYHFNRRSSIFSITFFPLFNLRYITY
jgi:hypothetical protein